MVRFVSLGAGASEHEALEATVAALAAGDLVILPTDTLYALGCQALNAAAVERVRRAKGRDDGKPLPLVIADRGQLGGLCARLPEALGPLAARFWPGPLSLVVPARPNVPGAVTSGSGTVAVRVPANAFLRSVCERVGPVVSTSANRSGSPAPSTCAAAVLEVGAFATLAVDGGEGLGEPSTLVDLTGDEPRLLRAGAVAWDAVAAALRDAAS